MVDFSGAFAAIGQSALGAAQQQLAAQASGGYGTSTDLHPATPPVQPVGGAPVASLPPQTTANPGPGGFFARNWKWLALGGLVIALVANVARRKRR